MRVQKSKSITTLSFRGTSQKRLHRTYLSDERGDHAGQEGVGDAAKPQRPLKRPKD
jgi:hypothetical protein